MRTPGSSPLPRCDSGDGRTDVDQAYYLTKSGEDYLVISAASDGMVARLDDFIQMMNAQRAAIEGASTGPRPDW